MNCDKIFIIVGRICMNAAMYFIDQFINNRSVETNEHENSNM